MQTVRPCTDAHAVWLRSALYANILFRVARYLSFNILFGGKCAETKLNLKSGSTLTFGDKLWVGMLIVICKKVGES